MRSLNNVKRASAEPLEVKCSWSCCLLQVYFTSRQTIFTMEQPGVVARKIAPSFWLDFLSIFVHISDSSRPTTLIWESLERPFPPAEFKYRWCQFWSKMMKSEVEERPRLVTGGYGRQRLQWVKTTVWNPELIRKQIILNDQILHCVENVKHKR